MRALQLLLLTATLFALSGLAASCLARDGKPAVTLGETQQFFAMLDASRERILTKDELDWMSGMMVRMKDSVEGGSIDWELILAMGGTFLASIFGIRVQRGVSKPLSKADVDKLRELLQASQIPRPVSAAAMQPA